MEQPKRKFILGLLLLFLFAGGCGSRQYYPQYSNSNVQSPSKEIANLLVADGSVNLLDGPAEGPYPGHKRYWLKRLPDQLIGQWLSTDIHQTATNARYSAPVGNGAVLGAITFFQGEGSEEKTHQLSNGEESPKGQFLLLGSTYYQVVHIRVEVDLQGIASIWIVGIKEGIDDEEEVELVIKGKPYRNNGYDVLHFTAIWFNPDEVIGGSIAKYKGQPNLILDVSKFPTK